MARPLMAILCLPLVLSLSLTSCGPSVKAPGSSMEEPDTLFQGIAPPPSASQAELPVIAPQVPQPTLTQADVEQALDAVMADYTAAAVSVATVEGGQLSQSGAWGWAVRGQREMTADTKVRAASLSKVALAMCAMALAEDGLLDLDAPLSRYWGDSVANPYRQTQPSVRTLMTHTSSLKDLELANGLSRLKSRLSAASAWRDREPGDGGSWNYSNFGASMLGVTLELAADQPLDQYLQARFLEPLAARASLHAGNLEAEEVACLYNAAGGVERSPAAQTGQSVPDQVGAGATYFPGGLTISAVDLAKLVAVLANDGTYGGAEYLTAASVADMESPRFSVDPGDTAPFEQCLILRRQEDLLGRPALYYHTGSSYGMYALLSYDPDTGDGVVVLTVGAPYQVEEHGLYALCSRLSQELYHRMEEDVI